MTYSSGFKSIWKLFNRAIAPDGKLLTSSEVIFDSDSAITDALGRERTSQTNAEFQTKFAVIDQAILFDESEVSGSGTSGAHDTDRGTRSLSVSNTTAGVRVMQSFHYNEVRYGDSCLIIFSAIFGTYVNGVDKEIGYFDDDNGLFFRELDDTFYVVERSSVTGSPVDTPVAQSAWNVDRLDGTGVVNPSGYTLDPTKSKKFFIDFSTRTGRVRFGIYEEGKPLVVHQFLNGNTLAAPFMTSQNLPIRMRIENDGTGAAASVEMLGAAVFNEGGSDSIGVARGIDRGATAFSTATGNTIQPLISIRLDATKKGASINPIDLTILPLSNVDYRWVILINPTVAGTDAASWVSLANSAVQYDVSRDNTNLLSGGTVINSGYGNSRIEVGKDTLSTDEQLGFAIDGTPQELVIGFQRVNGTASVSVFCGVNFKEYD